MVIAEKVLVKIRNEQRATIKKLIPTTRTPIGFGKIRPQLNNQLSLEVMLDPEKLKDIKEIQINGKRFIQFSINTKTLKEILAKKRNFIDLHYCPAHK